MKRFKPEPELHHFIKQNFIPQKDRFGYYDLYKCVHCKLVCKRYYGTNKLVVDRVDKRMTGCIERRRYPDRFRLWDWVCDYMYNG